MEVVVWLLAVPVLAIAMVVTAAVVLAGIYGLAVAAAAAALVLTYRSAGTSGLVVVGLCLVVPWLGALVLHRRRSAREARGEATDTRTPAAAPAVPIAHSHTGAVDGDVRSGTTTEIPGPRPPVPPLPAPPPKGRCPVCGRAVALTPARGRIKAHVTKGERCAGMGSVPAAV